jgi:hypothetical protein
VAQVSQWFASRADLILLLFDPYKLDISDEFKAAITAMKARKVRVVLTKSDTVDQQQLMLSGALMWSFLLKNPEVAGAVPISIGVSKVYPKFHSPGIVLIFQGDRSSLVQIYRLYRYSGLSQG